VTNSLLWVISNGGGQEDVENIAFPIITVVVWTVTAFKIVQQVKDPNLQRGFLIALIGTPGLSYLVAAPFVYHKVNALIGVPNVGTPIVYWGIMVFAFCSIAWLTGVLHPREELPKRLWPWAFGYLAAMIAMAVFFAKSPVEIEAEGSTGFDAMYADVGLIPWFIVTFNGSFAVALLAIGPSCWKWSRVTDRKWLRRGLPLIAIAAMCAMLYIIPKVIYVALRQFGNRVDALNTYAPLGAMAASLFFLLGFVLCAMGPASDYRARRRAYQAIYPMWKPLVAPFPELVLQGSEGPSDPSELVWPPRLKTLLYRRIVECRDARLRLRPWFDAAVADRARAQATASGLSGLEADAAAEAALLRASLVAHVNAASTPPLAAADGAEGGETAEARWYAEGNLAAEARWFAAVAHHFLRPIVPGETLTTTTP
jgi:Family of unknown function (DUF6545)